MKVEFHSLYWNNVDATMLKSHQKVMDWFNIPVNYHNLDGANHGLWMEWVIKNATSDIIAFFEPDCIPLNTKYLEYIKYAYKNKTLVGIAQVANHIQLKNHIFAGTGFYCISKEFYNKIGQPSLVPTHRGDTAEEICHRAEEMGLRYRTLMPTYFEREPEEGLWPLGSLGYFGIGTVYDDSIYHLFQARMAKNIELFNLRCTDVLNNKFDPSGFYKSTLFDYSGKIVP